MPRVSSLAGLLCCLPLLGAATLRSQAAEARSSRAEIGTDPYTKGAAEAIARAGYVAFGPFPFGARHDTVEVAELLGTEPLIWIETKHFRLGCALPTLELDKGQEWSKEWLANLDRELKELQKVLPTVNKKPRALDPWLRAHLFAWRLERLYAEVEQNLRAAAPAAAGEGTGAKPQSAGTGHGPYLGMDEKFTVLLLQKRSSHARYTSAWQGGEMGDPLRAHDPVFDCMYWGASEESAEGLLRIDLAMHAHTVFNVAHNLYSGYRGFRRPLPPWLATGLGHWHARRVSPRFPVHDRRDDHDRAERSSLWKWDERVLGMHKKGVFEPLETFVDRGAAGDFGLEQHIQCWALVDFLMATRRAELCRFVHFGKQSGSTQRQAFEQAFGCGLAVIERAWHEHVTRQRR